MTREGMEYISALLRADDASPEYEVGWAVWMTRGRDSTFEYLTEVMTNFLPGTRAFEVAYEIWLLMGGRGVAA